MGRGDELKNIVYIFLLISMGMFAQPYAAVNSSVPVTNGGSSMQISSFPVFTETFFESPDTATGHYTIDDADDSYGNFMTIESIDFGANIQPTQIAFKMYKTGNPGSVYMDICYTTDGFPDAVFATDTLDGDVFTTDTAGVYYNFVPSKCELNYGGAYVFKLRAPGADGANTLNIKYVALDTLGSTYVMESSDGTTWDMLMDHNLLTKIIGIKRSPDDKNLTGPHFLYGFISDEDLGRWVITLDKTINTTSSANIISATTLTQDGAEISIDSIHMQSSAVVYYTADVTGTVLRMSYTAPETGGIISSYDLPMASITDEPVYINNFGTGDREKSSLVWYPFNGDLIEVYTSIAATENISVGALEYVDTVLNFPSPYNSASVIIGDPGLTGDFTLSFRAYMAYDYDDNFFAFANTNSVTQDGFTVYFDGDGTDDYSINFSTGNGSTYSTVSSAMGDISEDTWHDVAIVVDVDGDGTDAYATIYVDGVLTNAADSVLDDMSDAFDISGKDFHLGALNAPRFGFLQDDKLDEFRIWNEKLTTDFIDSLEAFPFREPFGGTPTDPPSPTVDSVFTVILGPERFDDAAFAVPGNYTVAQAITDFYGTPSPYKPVDNGYAKLEIDNSDTCLVLYVDSGQWCNSSWNQSIYSSVDHYDEFYLSADIQYRLGWVQNAGGKHLGIYCWPAGSASPDGGTTPGMDPDQGWSSRSGWYFVDPVYTSIPGTLTDYVYSHDILKLAGKEYLLSNPITFDGSWINITRRFVMNTPGQRNGILEVFLDGECVFTKNNIIWLTTLTSAYDYTHIVFSLYFGGDKSYQTAQRDEYVKFDNVFLYTPAAGVPGSVNYPDWKSGYNTHTIGDKIPIYEGR